MTGRSPELEEAGRRGGWWGVAGLPVPVLIRLGRGTRGEIICTGVVFGVSEDGTVPVITTSSLRIPLAEVVSRLTRDRGRMGSLALLLGVTDRAPAATIARTRTGAKGHPDEHYRTVAAQYRAAMKSHPSAPTKTLIAEYENWSEATVRKWLREARRRGFLGRAPRGRAGEVKKRRRSAL